MTCGLPDVMQKLGPARFTMLAMTLDELAEVPPADLADMVKQLRKDARKLSGPEGFNAGIDVAILINLYIRHAMLFSGKQDTANALMEAARLAATDRLKT